MCYLAQLNYQSISTCISECGTPSWACFTYFIVKLSLKRNNNRYLTYHKPGLHRKYGDSTRGAKNHCFVFLTSSKYKTKLPHQTQANCQLILPGQRVGTQMSEQGFRNITNYGKFFIISFWVAIFTLIKEIRQKENICNFFKVQGQYD